MKHEILSFLVLIATAFGYSLPASAQSGFRLPRPLAEVSCPRGTIKKARLIEKHLTEVSCILIVGKKKLLHGPLARIFGYGSSDSWTSFSAHYEFGKLHGKVFRVDGSESREDTYKSGKRHGPSVIQGGCMSPYVEWGFYQKGKRHGVWSSGSELGSATRKCLFKKGQEIRCSHP